MAELELDAEDHLLLAESTGGGGPLGGRLGARIPVPFSECDFSVQISGQIIRNGNSMTMLNMAFLLPDETPGLEEEIHVGTPELLVPQSVDEEVKAVLQPVDGIDAEVHVLAG